MSKAAQKVMELVQAADRVGALDLATSELERGERHPLILMLAAERLDEQGKHTASLALLREAVSQTGEEPELWRRYGIALARAGLYDKSRAALEEADDLWPDQPAILMPLATACYRSGDLAGAERHFADLSALMPGSPEPLAARAAIAVQQGQTGMGRELARQALALAPANVTAGIALARAALEEGDAAEADLLASAQLSRLPRGDENRIALLGLRADARDRLGRPGDAYLDYSTRNALLIAQYTSLRTASGEERPVDRARRLGAYLDGADSGVWAKRPEDLAPTACAGHLFVVGFPRSGTTLLEKALSGHDMIRTLPEIDCLAAAGLELLADTDGFNRLAALPPADCAILRARYFAAITEAVGDVAGKVVVDKMPLHSLALPLISRVFPHAKIVLSLRDPRDVVLSGFRRRFQMNASMFELLTLRGAADFYDGVMALVTRCEEVLPIGLHKLRHEDLVADFEGEVRRVLALIGLDWQDDIAQFPARAIASARTPSDYQLRKGLNRDGIGAWRPYARELRAVADVLAPWVQRWGYTD